MCIHIYIYIYIYIHTYILYVISNMCMYILIHVSVHLCMYINIHICIYIIHAQLNHVLSTYYIYTHIHIHIYIYMCIELVHLTCCVTMLLVVSLLYVLRCAYLSYIIYHKLPVLICCSTSSGDVVDHASIARDNASSTIGRALNRAFRLNATDKTRVVLCPCLSLLLCHIMYVYICT